MKKIVGIILPVALIVICMALLVLFIGWFDGHRYGCIPSPETEWLAAGFQEVPEGGTYAFTGDYGTYIIEIMDVSISGNYAMATVAIQHGGELGTREVHTLEKDKTRITFGVYSIIIDEIYTNHHVLFTIFVRNPDFPDNDYSKIDIISISEGESYTFSYDGYPTYIIKVLDMQFKIEPDIGIVTLEIVTPGPIGTPSTFTNDGTELTKFGEYGILLRNLVYCDGNNAVFDVYRMDLPLP